MQVRGPLPVVATPYSSRVKPLIIEWGTLAWLARAFRYPVSSLQGKQRRCGHFPGIYRVIVVYRCHADAGAGMQATLCLTHICVADCHVMPGIESHDGGVCNPWVPFVDISEGALADFACNVRWRISAARLVPQTRGLDFTGPPAQSSGVPGKIGVASRPYHHVAIASHHHCRR